MNLFASISVLACFNIWMFLYFANLLILLTYSLRMGIFQVEISDQASFAQELGFIKIMSNILIALVLQTRYIIFFHLIYLFFNKSFHQGISLHLLNRLILIFHNLYMLLTEKNTINSLEDKYHIIKKIGAGSFSEVFLIKQKTTQNKQFAMKKVKLFGMSHYQKQNAINQVSILASIKHKNIVALSESIYDRQEEILYLILQYFPEGDLQQIISKHKMAEHSVKQSIVWKIIADVTSGLFHLHKAGIIHRDIKPANIFKTDANGYKISDFNISKIIENDGKANSVIGSPYFISPQIKLNEQYDSKCDIWSLGVLIHEICSLKNPFSMKFLPLESYKYLPNEQIEPISDIYSMTLQDLLKHMLTYDAEERYSAEEVLKYCRKCGISVDLEQIKIDPIVDLAKAFQLSEVKGRFFDMVKMLDLGSSHILSYK